MTWLALLGFWLACAALNWRHALRYFNAEMEPDEWFYLTANLLFATFFSLIAGPFWLAMRIFMATAGQRVDPATFAMALEGAPRRDRKQRRIDDLEKRNADLERQLGL
jgi:hypothetical protein